MTVGGLKRGEAGRWRVEDAERRKGEAVVRRRGEEDAGCGRGGKRGRGAGVEGKERASGEGAEGRGEEGRGRRPAADPVPPLSR